MVEIKSNNYSIFIGNGIEKPINRYLKINKSKYNKLFLLVDENSLRFCYPYLADKVPAFREAELIEIESGEENKNIEICSQIWETLSENKATRNTLFINLGGGVISDLGGFAAATFKRGIDFINIPTTLLAQVDASIGGKVGIDLNKLKNEIGVFCNPQAVFVNPDFLGTLDKRQVLSGFAEIIKHGLIANNDYWKELQEINFSDITALNVAIEKSIDIKNEIVTADFNEQTIRKKLNFGHTIGHALESYFLEQADKQVLLHGEAIAIGIICESFLSFKLCGLSERSLYHIVNYINANFKSVRIDEVEHQRILELMRHDKKNEKGEINFSLLSSIGKCEINKTASAEMIMDALKFYAKTNY
jgi:3-dehydroquinate synthase